VFNKRSEERERWDLKKERKRKGGGGWGWGGRKKSESPFRKKRWVHGKLKFQKEKRGEVTAPVFRGLVPPIGAFKKEKNR